MPLADWLFHINLSPESFLIVPMLRVGTDLHGFTEIVRSTQRAITRDAERQKPRYHGVNSVQPEVGYGLPAFGAEHGNNKMMLVGADCSGGQRGGNDLAARVVVIPAQAGSQQDKYSAMRTRPRFCYATRGLFNQLDSGLRRNDEVYGSLPAITMRLNRILGEIQTTRSSKVGVKS